MFLRQASPTSSTGRYDRSRGNTAQIYTTRVEEPSEKLQPRPSIRSNRAPSTSSTQGSPPRDTYLNRPIASRPLASRSSTFEGPTALRDSSPTRSVAMHRVPTDPSVINSGRANLRQVEEQPDGFSSPERSLTPRSASPSTSYGSLTPASSVGVRRGPPPPPPSRAKKPAPPPPPMKRSGLSSANVLQA